MGTQCWETEENSCHEAVDVVGSRSGWSHHPGLLTLFQGWAGAPCPPCTTGSSRPRSCRSPGSPGAVSPLGEMWGCLCTPVPSWVESLGHICKRGVSSHPPYPQSSLPLPCPATSPWFTPCSEANFFQLRNFIAPSVRNIQRLFNIK